MLTLEMFNFADIAVLSLKMFNFVILLLLSLGTTFFKNKIYTLIPVILTTILFFIFRDENYFTTALLQILISFITIIVNQIINKKYKNKKQKEIDKTKIKDLS